ncbi:MAG: cobalamin B12-binding domain-containing protein [Chloroflexi bacterium]|nr:cobalamin B12-binding domain-containing protein [Chloroflexota bacterium]
MADKKKIRVLLAQFPLESHNRGLITVAGMLRDAGMEVILMGNARSENIVGTALQEAVDVVGISTYCGGELAQGKELMSLAEKKGIKDRTVFILGGIYPPSDEPKLKQIGFSAVFPPSSSKEDIVSGIQCAIATKS